MTANHSHHTAAAADSQGAAAEHASTATTEPSFDEPMDGLVYAVTAALANNADVKTAQANLDKAQAANRAAQADPSTLVAAKLSASNAFTEAQAATRNARLNTLQNTITAYTSLLEAQENVELQTLQVQVDQKAVQIAQTKQTIGNATALDVQNAQNTLTGSQQTLADARAQVNLAAAKADGLGCHSGRATMRAAALPSSRCAR